MHPQSYGRTYWDGRYFVTLVLSGGKVIRQDAAFSVPVGAIVAACDNGMQGRRYYEQIRRELREQYKR